MIRHITNRIRYIRAVLRHIWDSPTVTERNGAEATKWYFKRHPAPQPEDFGLKGKSQDR